MENRKLNKILKRMYLKDKNGHFYYKRVGRCNYQKCGSACCRFKTELYEDTPGKVKYFQLAFFQKGTCIEVKKIKKGKINIVSAFHCPNISICGKCKYHGKKEQPSICDGFPMHPDDGVYEYVKDHCSYKFEKVYDKEIPAKLKKKEEEKKRKEKEATKKNIKIKTWKEALNYVFENGEIPEHIHGSKETLGLKKRKNTRKQQKRKDLQRRKKND